MQIQNYYFNIINKIVTERSRNLLRDYQELKSIRTKSQKKTFFKKSYYLNAIHIQQQIESKNSAFGFYINNDLVKKAKNSQYWQIRTVDDEQNYINNISIWCVQISLFVLSEDNKKEYLFSYSYSPLTDETWTFDKDSAGLYNKTKINCQNNERENDYIERHYGSEIMMILLYVIGKVDFLTINLIKNEELTEHALFILNISKANYEINNNNLYCK